MTETSSQIVTAPLSSLNSNEAPVPTVLSHSELRISENGFLEVKSKSLLTCSAKFIDGQLLISEPVDANGWFLTEDRAEITELGLKVLGRGSDYIKVAGEAVNLARLRRVFDSLIEENAEAQKSLVLHHVEDQRLGRKVVLFQMTEDDEVIRRLVEKYNSMVLPFERIKARYRVPMIPRTDLGKIQWELLQSFIQGEL